MSRAKLEIILEKLSNEYRRGAMISVAATRVQIDIAHVGVPQFIHDLR